MDGGTIMVPWTEYPLSSVIFDNDIDYFSQVPAAMDGVPAPISMLVDPSTNPEAIALVS